MGSRRDYEEIKSIPSFLMGTTSIANHHGVDYTKGLFPSILLGCAIKHSGRGHLRKQYALAINNRNASLGADNSARFMWLLCRG
jgi:hypothetical protein